MTSFFGLADRDVNTKHVLIFLVDDGVQRDLGFAGFLIADDQLTLTAADRIEHIDAGDARQHRPADRRPFHDRNRRSFNFCFKGVREALLIELVHAEHIDDMADRLGRKARRHPLAGGDHLILQADRFVNPRQLTLTRRR